MYDLTVTAALRQSLVDRCLKATKRFLTVEPTNVFVNIDPAGNESSAKDIWRTVQHYYPNATIRQPRQPSFPLAVKWLWKSVESPAVLHVEDSKEIIHKVDVEWLISALNDLGAISLKFFNPGWQNVGPPNVQKRPDGLWQTDYYDKAVCMQPTMWRCEVVRNLAGWMRNGVSPEKTIRPGQFNPAYDEVVSYMRQFKFGFVTDQHNVFWYNRHGPSWRARTGYRKKQGGIPDTWKK